MATRTESVLLSVKIDQAAAKKQSAELTITLQKEKAELSNLEKQFKSGVIAEQQYAQEKVRLQAQIKQTNQQLGLYSNAATAAKGSTKALASEVALLRNQVYNSSNPTKEQKDRLKELSDQLNETKKETGDFTSNIGRYTSSILDAAKQLPVLGGAIRNAEQAIQIMKASFISARAAAIAFTAVPIVLVLSGIIAFLTQADDGIDALEQNFNGFKAGLNVIVDRFVALGRAIFEGKVALEDFGNGFARFFEGAGKEAAKAFELEKQLTAQSQQLDDQEAKLSVTLLKRQGIVDQLILQARDQNKTFQERLDGLKTAGELELKNLNESVSLAQQRLSIEQQRNKLDKEKDEGEAIKREAELQSKVIQLQNDAAAKRQEIANRTSSLQQQLIADTLAEQKKAFDQEIKDNQLTLDVESSARAKELQTGLQAYQTFEGELAKLNTQRIKDDAHASLERYNATKAALEALRDLGIDVNDEIADNEEQFRQEQIKGEIDANNQIYENRKRHEARMKHLQELRFQSAEAVANAIADLENLINRHGAENTAFAKLLALSQIAINTAVAIGKAVAAASGEPFPANVIAIATSVGAVLSAISQTDALLNKANTPAPPQFGGGGDFLTQGPQLIMVGDNPGGVERVTVEPISGKGQTKLGQGANLLHLAGGGSVTAFGAGQFAGQTIINQVNNQIASNRQIVDGVQGRIPVLVVETEDRVRDNMQRVEVNSTV